MVVMESMAVAIYKRENISDTKKKWGCFVVSVRVYIERTETATPNLLTDSRAHVFLTREHRETLPFLLYLSQRSRCIKTPGI